MKNILFISALSVLLLSCNSQDTNVAKSANTQNNQEKIDEQKETYDAHRSYTQLHFEDDEMDFAFQWILGSIANGGCEIGEAFYVAGNIEDGSPESWQIEWEKMAILKEQRAESALSSGHQITARECYLKASNYYRTAIVSMLPDHPKFESLNHKVRFCMKEAAKLFSPEMISFEIPFENTVLPGYFRAVDSSLEKRKTLLMIGGGETYIEDNYFYIAPQAIKRGYNFITVDLPGQGMMPMEGQFFRKDTETQMKVILDYVLSLPNVDPEKIAVFGISNGGYFVPRAFAYSKENRMKAMIVSSAVVDNYLMFQQMPFSKDSQEQIDKWPAFKTAVTSAVTWRWGLDPSDIKGQVEQTKGFNFDPKKITCPVLDLVGAGEYANQETERQQKEFMDNITNKNSKLIITPANEGASSHCISENRSLMAELVFDWLDDTFEE